MKKYLIIGLVTLTGCGLIDQILSPEKPDPTAPKIVETLRNLLNTASNTNTYGGIAIGVLSSIWIAIRGHRVYKKIKNGKTKSGNGSSSSL